MINKKCDYCNKNIEGKDDDSIGYSEWCVYHFKKRRDFCSDECFLKFVIDKLVLKKQVKGGDRENAD